MNRTLRPILSGLACSAVAAGLLLFGATAAGATGVNFTIGQGCSPTNGTLVTVNVANPVDVPLRIDEASPSGLVGIVPAHGSRSVTVDVPAGNPSPFWVDFTGVFVGHMGDEFYGTPGVVEDLPWSDGIGVTLREPCPITVPADEPTTTTTTLAPPISLTPPTTITNLTPDTTPVSVVSNATTPVVVADTVADAPPVCCAAGTAGTSSPESPAAARGPELAFTGTGIGVLLGSGGVALVCGLGLMRLGYRLRAPR